MPSRCYFSSVNHPEHEADHLPPSIVEIKNGGAISPLPPHVFMMWCLTSNGGDVIFIYTSNKNSSIKDANTELLFPYGFVTILVEHLFVFNDASSTV
jgi:hypothetical protein